MVYIIALISIMLGAFAQYLLKVGVQQVIWYKDEGFYTLMSGLINMRLLSGILCYGLSLLFWLYVLSKIELSRAYPLVSLGYVFTLLLGHFLLNESVTCNKIIGVFFILVGVYFISRM